MTTLFIRRSIRAGRSRASALCLLALAAALFGAQEARAQWTTSGTNTTTTGNVGIGTAAPEASLHISSPSTAVGARGAVVEQTSNDGTAALFIVRKSRAGAAVANGDYIGAFYASAFDGAGWQNSSRMRFVVDAPVAAGSVPTGMQFLTGGNATTSVERMRISSAGNVGIGTAAPGVLNGVGFASYVPLHIQGTTNRFVVIDSPVANSGLIINDSSQALDSRIWGMTLAAGGGKLTFSTYTDAGTNSDKMVLDRAGNLGVGTTAPLSKLHVAGDIRVDGNISAKYQDVAEWVPSTQKLAAGTVVILDTGRENHVLASSGSYDTRVAGVVSAQPGISLGEAGEGKALVATTGRVKVKVDASRAPIRIGDLIVTSDAEGVAMRSEPVSLGGVHIHRPGTIIGKALEPLAKGTGEILVLLSLQ